LTCPKCYHKPGHYFSILKVPHLRADLQCPNCKTRLVEASKIKGVSGVG
jgi:hypothetical protein